ncbi:hypothetical protein K491DRAFT_687441 [Lophiostoma macrostomum CBS 122681]|uniref:Uncharacterized protein n=1 Tax=Lophiostoma macrostomum CBS 122681 TaxID=1314788 RepID=A0A6A6TMK5_9PLEO|nr:hypothetical protein K491DRAFT_687441 [Lophiostoma macrostomum CBS 122681]
MQVGEGKPPHGRGKHISSMRNGPSRGGISQSKVPEHVASLSDSMAHAAALVEGLADIRCVRRVL